MKLKFFKAHEIDRNVKCAIHKTGKLGFSSGANEKLGLSSSVSVTIGMNEDDESDENLYMVLADSNNPEAFRVSKAGDYYYVNTKPLFDHLGVDYRKKKIIYDIVDFDYEGMKMFKLIKREVKQKQ